MFKTKKSLTKKHSDIVQIKGEKMVMPDYQVIKSGSPPAIWGVIFARTTT